MNDKLDEIKLSKVSSHWCFKDLNDMYLIFIIRSKGENVFTFTIFITEGRKSKDTGEQGLKKEQCGERQLGVCDSEQSKSLLKVDES